MNELLSKIEGEKFIIIVNKKGVYITFSIFLMILCSFASFTTVSADKSNCKAMKNQRVAKAALKAGATWLDRNGDGKPCQNLPK